MKKLLSIALTAAVMCTSLALPAKAKTWVTVSSWAYNDVSNFKKEGLLPESFEDVADYTQNVTRLQFAELLYSAIIKSKIDSGYGGSNRYFADTDSKAANYLAEYGIMTGEVLDEYKDIFGDTKRVVYTSHDENGNEEYLYNFYPDRLLTREEMAAVLYRTTEGFCSYVLIGGSAEGSAVNEPKDMSDISDWAKESVGKMLSVGMLSGMDDGSFAPKNNLTIEQAIVAVYGLYNNLPTAPEADGARLSGDYEQTVQSYSNGLTETKKGDILYLKNGDKTLMEFETDIYSNIYCITVNDVIYAAAQNCYGKTDVYNAQTKEILFKIPYPITSVDGDYINTKSSNIGPMTFGLYDYSGREILEPKYSWEEIAEIKANGMKIPEDKYQSPGGWIYYSDWNDGGHMYRMDSNGENKQKLSNHNCFDIECINGWLYYYVKDDEAYPVEKRLYIMRADGKYEQRLTEYRGSLCDGRYYTREPSPNSSDGNNLGAEYDTEEKFIFLHDDKWTYYMASNGPESDNPEDFAGASLWRVSMDGDKVNKEKISGDLKVTYDAQLKDGKIYFTDWNIVEDEEGYDNIRYLYCYDGEEVKKITDKPITDYAFYNDKLVLCFKADEYYADLTVSNSDVYYLADLDGSNITLWQEVMDAQAQFKEKHGEDGNKQPGSDRSEYVFDECSDDKYTVYSIYEWEYDENGYKTGRDALAIRDSSGKETSVSENGGNPVIRVDNILYYMYKADDGEHNGYNVALYNMDTGERKAVASDIQYIDWRSNADGDDWFTYTDFSFNTWRYDCDTETLSEIFPNANLKKYGKVERMLGLNIGMYKVDVDGNYSFVTDEYAADCLYVDNEKSEGKNF